MDRFVRCVERLSAREYSLAWIPACAGMTSDRLGMRNEILARSSVMAARARASISRLRFSVSPLLSGASPLSKASIKPSPRHRDTDAPQAPSLSSSSSSSSSSVPACGHWKYFLASPHLPRCKLRRGSETAMTIASSILSASTIEGWVASVSIDNLFSLVTHCVPNHENLFQRSERWSFLCHFNRLNNL